MKRMRVWDHGKAITDCLFLFEESSESATEYVQSYPSFCPVVADGLEVQPNWP